MWKTENGIWDTILWNPSTAWCLSMVRLIQSNETGEQNNRFTNMLVKYYISFLYSFCLSGRKNRTFFKYDEIHDKKYN